MHIALRHPRLRRLLAALAVSQLGDWLYNLALLAYVEDRTHSATWLGLTTAARVAPLVALGPLGGVVADRFDRRAVMICSDALRAALMGLLAVAAVTGLPVVLAPVLAGLATAAAAPYPPSVAASVPRLVDDAALPAANALRAAIGPTSIVAGPLLGAVLLLLGPPSVVFALNGLTFAASALLVGSIPAGAAFRPGAAAAPASGILADLRSGAAALVAHRAACRLVVADIACSVAYGAQTVLLVDVGRRLGLGAAGYGYLLGAVGAGGVLGAALAGRLGDVGHRRGILSGALLLVAVPLPLLALMGSIAGALGLALLTGAGSLVVEVLAETGLQRALPAELLGRAYGFALPAALAGIVAGSLVAPLLMAPAGLGGALAILGAGVAVVAAALARAPRPAAALPAPV